MDTTISDAQLIRWLRDHLEWDGHGYWLPEICIREIAFGEVDCPEPTLKEFRAALSEHAKGSK